VPRPWTVSATALAQGLAGSCHPGPTAAVTALSTGLLLRGGAPGPRAAIIGAAVLGGQLGIGWSNDLLDVARDPRPGRTDKPLVNGLVSARAVGVATVTALTGCVGLSLAVDRRAGALHLLAVSGGLAYNVGLKRTPGSPLPYAMSFGLLPVFLVRASGGAPAGWLPLAGALLGGGAHMFDALADIADDRDTGVRSLPAVLGPAFTRITGAVLLTAAAAVLAFGPDGGARRTDYLGLAGAVVLSAAAAAPAVDGGPARSRRPFALAVACAAVDAAMLAGRLARPLGEAPARRGATRPARFGRAR
jgi:4-hydroxybenzoate polyprenyltransferase